MNMRNRRIRQRSDFPGPSAQAHEPVRLNERDVWFRTAAPTPFLADWDTLA